jgi:outer membrane protein OmpA-like peptidoglycan-associated protein
MQTALEAAQSQSAELTSQLADVKARMTRTEADLAQSRDDLKRVQDESASASQDLQDQLAKSERITAVQGEELAKVQTEMTALMEARDTALADRQTLQTELESLTAQLDAKGAEATRIEAALSAALANKKALETKSAQLTATVEDATSAVSERDSKLAALDAEAADLKSQIETIKGEFAQASEVQKAELRRATIDRCAQTVDAQLAQATVNFASNTSDLTPPSRALLERLSGLVLACVTDEVEVEIAGHTDDRGSDDINMALSDARASVVRQFMIERGVPGDNLVAVGFGETQPIASNDTREGRAANRRISLEWRLR